MRRPLVAGNWKMYGSRVQARERAEAIVNWYRQFGQRAQQFVPQGEVGQSSAMPLEVVLFPPAVHLQQVAEVVAGSGVGVGAQDVHEAPFGAHTGDIAAEMVADMGGTFAIVGHSERRQRWGESDTVVASKVAAALRARLTPVLCIGESLDERRAGRAAEVMRRQLGVVTARIGEQIEHCVVAYEPIWAIGTGETATPAQVVQMHRLIREELGTAGGVRILYGGSVKADNAAALFGEPEVDGGLVGGASLIVEQFLAICASAGAR